MNIKEPSEPAAERDLAEGRLAADILDHIAMNYADSDARDLELGLDTELIELNLLDSFSVLELVSYLHTEHGAQISIEKIQLENFGTIRKICRLVRQTRESGGGSASAHGGVL